MTHGRRSNEGSVLDWAQIREIAAELRARGVQQVLQLWKSQKDREDDPFLWGDETEGNLISFDDDGRHIDVSPTSIRLLEVLKTKEKDAKFEQNAPTKPCFVPESAVFTVESMPGRPWGSGSDDFLQVESNMRWRRDLIAESLSRKQCYLTTTVNPRLGAEKQHHALHQKAATRIMRSEYLSDDTLTPFPRYHAVATNIRSRRKCKVSIKIPVYRDLKTIWPFRDPAVEHSVDRWSEDDEVRSGAVEEGCVHMDSMVGGTSCCSLQVTMQASNIDEARNLYDQLIPLGPIMLALTAATPIFRGYLTDVDVRWPQLAMSLDDRTPEELAKQTFPNSKTIRTRCSSNPAFIAHDARLRSDYQLSDVQIDGDTLRQLQEGGMDEQLATHFAHLFLHEPLVVHADSVDVDTERDTSLFDTIQSTNWGTVRFKPPPSLTGGDIGWRVEFRSMEVQLTDFENAAFAVFMVLLSRALVHFKASLYMPISKVDENMEKAYGRDAVVSKQFWFVPTPKSPHYTPIPISAGRRDNCSVTSPWMTRFSGTSSELPDSDSSSADGRCVEDRKELDSPITSRSDSPASLSDRTDAESEPALLTIDEIMNGQESANSKSPGLIALVREYVHQTGNLNTKCIAKIEEYLALVSSRARGSAWTSAKWQRDFVRSHPQYQEDSVVGAEIAYDLLKAQKDVTGAGGVDALCAGENASDVETVSDISVNR